MHNTRHGILDNVQVFKGSVDGNSAVLSGQETDLKHNISLISFISREQGLQQLCFYIRYLHITLDLYITACFFSLTAELV